MRDIQRAEECVRELLISLGLDIDDPNLVGTPRRVAKWLASFTLSEEEVAKRCEEHGNATFPATADDMVALEPFLVYSICPHHLLPVQYLVSLAYIPNGKVTGLSKLVRISREMAKRPLLQETYVPLLADMLVKVLGTEHVAVRVVGTHECMKVRGVMCESPTVITALRGAFKTNPSLKQEFYDIVSGGRLRR